MNIKRPKVPHIQVTTTPRVPNFALRPATFERTLKGQRYPMHVTTPEFQISLCFPLQPVVFELQGILRQVEMTPQITLNTKRSQVLHMHVTNRPPTPHRIPNSTPFHPTESYRPLWASAPKMSLNTKRWKVLHYSIYMSQLPLPPVPNFTLFHSTAT